MSKNKKIIIGIVNILIIVIFIWLFVIVARLQDGITIYCTVVLFRRY